MQQPGFDHPWETLRRLGRRLLGRWSPERTGRAHRTGLRPDGGEPEDTHLADLPDGAGCTEIWEHLSGESAAGVIADD